MLRQSSEDVNCYFVFFSSQKDAAAAGQCIVFNEVCFLVLLVYIWQS